MVASHLRAVDDLNGRARTALRAAGLLGPDQVTLGKLSYTTGDEVLALRNDYDLVILNGTRSVIDHIDPRQGQFAVLTDDGRRVQIPFDYAAAGYLTHGYATTIHKAQGATVDRCFILADETTSREHAYTEAATATTSTSPPTSAELKKAMPPRSTPNSSTASGNRSVDPSDSTSPPTLSTQGSSETIPHPTLASTLASKGAVVPAVEFGRP